MAQKIITIGFNIPGHPEFFYSYSSEQSLLDADIVVFEPTIYYYSTGVNFQGKTCYTADSSFCLTEATRRWRAELSTALEHGKTVFVFFSKFEEFFVHTGESRTNGTGRSAHITNTVTGSDNYQFFPVRLPKIIAKTGSEIRFSGNPIFATFWSEFGGLLKYESYLDEKIGSPLFITKTGEKVVGGLFKVGKGNLVLLPPIRYSKEEFNTVNKKGEKALSDKGKKFGARLVQILVDIDKALREVAETTPPPVWAGNNDFVLPEVEKIKEAISQVGNKIDTLMTDKNKLLQSLSEEGRLSALLFEKGKPLENAIILALQIIGYSAENYNDGSLELDQVIISPEKERFIGEAEGKDTVQLNIDKFRQLESNIQEDLQRDEVKEPAIGILFGNAFRLIEPDKRDQYFTVKCIKNAERLNAILIRTPDLFQIARYIRTSGDKNFAQKCREAIIQGRGKIIAFPEVPKV